MEKQEMYHELPIDARQFSALIGLARHEFEILLENFTKIYNEWIWESYKDTPKRKRKPGGGSKGGLETKENKLFFILRYLKSYPTYDTLGWEFGMNRSTAYRNVHKLFPILMKTLEKKGVMPHREFKNAEEFKQEFYDIAELLIDATERPVQRPMREPEQTKHYSGKQKDHTVKNTVIGAQNTSILYLGPTVPGSQHDYGLFKQEFDPKQDWFKPFSVWADLGYTGFDKDYEVPGLHIPAKKPPRSKNNPNPRLTAEQRSENKAISQIRIRVEHSLSGLKRFNILCQDFRGHVPNFIDDVAATCAGLWNFKIAIKEFAILY